jgi:hypothetical protein
MKSRCDEIVQARILSTIVRRHERLGKISRLNLHCKINKKKLKNRSQCEVRKRNKRANDDCTAVQSYENIMSRRQTMAPCRDGQWRVSRTVRSQCEKPARARAAQRVSLLPLERFRLCVKHPPQGPNSICKSSTFFHFRVLIFKC